MWRRRRRHHDPESDVVAEAVGLLTGTTIERLRGHNAHPTIPSWLLVNTLAHAQPANLRQWAAGVFSWRDTNLDASLTRLSRLILDTAANGTTANDTTVLALQRKILVPLELSMLSGAWRRFPPATLEPTVARAIAGTQGAG